MAIEIEKKYRVTSEQFTELESELADTGAEFVGEDFEENIIYGGEVLAGDAVLRIRKTKARTLLTFKRRIENQSDAKQQVEIETEVADAGATAEIIENLGLASRLVYEKRRKTYKLKSAEIVLDELPFGLFVEIEGSLLAIKEAEMILGMEDFVIEHETYPRLTARLGTAAGDVIEARFPA
ncbi:MAG TPA: class IV adenylate cyclase [Pyrinomonadaceae bacterium]|nr:class IV adenylate cyclase [Pyrinomonadaceae bacterium]